MNIRLYFKLRKAGIQPSLAWKAAHLPHEQVFNFFNEVTAS